MVRIMEQIEHGNGFSSIVVDVDGRVNEYLSRDVEQVIDELELVYGEVQDHRVPEWQGLEFSFRSGLSLV